MSLSILNVGHGDTKISFDPKNPKEVERAKTIVQDMLRRGYAILVECGQRKGKPVYYRATEFDEKTCEYIIDGMPEQPDWDTEVLKGPPAESQEPMPDQKIEEKPRRGRPKGRVQAHGAKAVAVARSAGGMSAAANSIEMDNMRRFDGLAGLRQGLTSIADERGEWAGIPMPIAGLPLTIEPTYPRAKELMDLNRPEEQPDTEETGYRLRNSFFSDRLRKDVLIVERLGWAVNAEEPQFSALVVPRDNTALVQLRTMDASAAWGIEQEHAALQTLAPMLNHVQFKRYLLAGMFMESSARSGICYVFRKLRPTIAISLGRAGFGEDYQPKIIAVLCMHPIAYYSGTHAGCMCPTDDVIAHLSLMRGDEKLFWRRSNQHHPNNPWAGL